MKTYLSKFIAIISLTGGAIIASVGAGAWSSPKNFSTVPSYENMYTLGDSLSDNGVFAHLLYSYNILNNAQPGQIDMDGAFYNHSFSDGPVAAEKLANKLGLDLDYGYHYQGYYKKINNRFGYNYALAGGRAGTMFEQKFLETIFGKKLPKILSFWITLGLKDWFNKIDFQSQVDALTFQHQQLTAKDLVLVEIGGNDIFVAASRSEKTEQQAVINQAVTNEVAGIKTLLSHTNQATILVGNLPDVSLVPVEASKKELAKQLTQDYNNELSEQLSPYIQQHEIKYVDLFTEFHTLYHEFETTVPHANVTDPAITEKINLALSFKKPFKFNTAYNPGVSKDNIDSYFFFDRIHPNNWATTKMADYLYTQLK